MAESLPTVRVFLCHGMRQNATDMEGIASLFARPGFERETVDYDWRRPVVETGLELADRVAGGREQPDHTTELFAHRPVLLIGFSQGGLLCRVAAAAIAGKRRAPCGELGHEEAIVQRIEEWSGPRSSSGSPPLAVVTIATPNSGALTFGQMSVAMRALASTLREILVVRGRHHLNDLTTDRLVRALQHFEVGADFHSFSGSRFNRFSLLSGGDLSIPGPVSGFGSLSLNLDLPNDSIVEDSSVDMRNATFLPEVDLARYRHYRMYVGCTEASHLEGPGHTRILDNPYIRDKLVQIGRNLRARNPIAAKDASVLAEWDLHPRAD